MQSTTTLVVPARLHSLASLAVLLEKLERTALGASPDQYRALAAQIGRLLDAAPADDALDQLLKAFPATAEIYENRQYRHAGLCRSALDAALDAELAARACVERARSSR